jgi:hypothetical protein
MTQTITGRAFQTTRSRVNLKLDFCLDYDGEINFNGNNYADVKNQVIKELKAQKYVGKVKLTFIDPKRLSRGY